MGSDLAQTRMDPVPKSRFEFFDLSFKVYYDLMQKKVMDILLVSSPYDAFIMEEDGRLTERIIHEYKGLNLSRPPRISWVSTAQKALSALEKKYFDMVITMPRLDDMAPGELGKKIKESHPNTPIFLLNHHTGANSASSMETENSPFDKMYVWCGNTDLLLALVKNVEDKWNVDYDTKRAAVRVIILVEDSPIYCSSILPILYKEIVSQTQAVMDDTVNEEHRLLRMRARPKILVAETFEEAEKLYRRFRKYLLCVISDVGFPRKGKLDPDAGYTLLKCIRAENPDLPLLNFSSEEKNRDRALTIPAVFLNKNSPSLLMELRAFFTERLGFGDFIFRTPDGRPIPGAVARNLRSMEKILPGIPKESLLYHASKNHFSTWLMARSEVGIALFLKPFTPDDFSSTRELRRHLIATIHERRKHRQRGLITDFSADSFDPELDFFKLGKGSLGGKGRGLAFFSTRLGEMPELQEKYPNVQISVPKTLVISTEAFDAFIAKNRLRHMYQADMADARIQQAFVSAAFPESVRRDLRAFLEQADYPLAVRSSSLLEDAQFRPFAGIYKTYMIPNRDISVSTRLSQLLTAAKLVYASTFLKSARAYTRSTLHRTEEEKMAVVIQELTGTAHGDLFYPAISGVAQSYNFYPISYMKPDEGIVNLALGLGKTVVEGGTCVRFSPKYPEFLPQFSTVEDILKNAQRSFYALKLNGFPDEFLTKDDATLARLEVESATDSKPVRSLCSTYFPEDNRIRDMASAAGHPVLTFARILKHRAFPLPEILSDVLALARTGMGCPVEIEFAADFNGRPTTRFDLLQVRPMAKAQTDTQIVITKDNEQNAFCLSTMALGNGRFSGIKDIVYVKPGGFDPAQMPKMAEEIGRFNEKLTTEDRKYLLAGPGRWGSADRWLGIGVSWNEISGIGSIVETFTPRLNTDPSQGSHFFHNITSLGISYITVPGKPGNFFDYKWLDGFAAQMETDHIRHVRFTRPVTILIDGKTSRAVVLKP